MSIDSNAVPSASEPCPTPLAWQQVAQSFHESANSRIIETERCELKVVEFGSGRPVVFLPIPYGSSRLYCLSAWLLKDEYRSLLIEAPRFASPPTPERFVYEAAEAISLAIEHLSPGGADLYASSISSQIALQIMATRPHAVRSAFLQGAWARREFTVAESLMLQTGRWLPAKLRQIPFWQSAQIENHRRWFPPFDETRFGFLLQEAGESRACDVATRLLASARTDLRPVLPDIRQPVAVLHCEGEGRQIAAAQAELEAGIPHVQHLEMFHSGLFPYLTHPHRLIKLLKPFWQSVETAASTASSSST